VNYWETFAPVVTWISIRLILILSILLCWHTRQIDFILAYPQAPLETPLFMEIPKGVTMHNMPRRAQDYVLELKKNLYGQKQAGRLWYKHLTQGLLQLGFRQSVIDECVFYRQGTTFLVYVDDGIIAGPKKEDIDQIIVDLQTMFNVSDEGDLTDYLGVNIETREDGTIKLSQPHLIDQIIKDANFQADTKFKATPAATTKILHKDPSGNPHHATWHYRGIIGKLNFLEKSTRGELGYAVHQCARFCEEPTELHTDAVHHIVRFLAGTRGKGIILNPKKTSFECFVLMQISAGFGTKKQPNMTLQLPGLGWVIC
jgi:Reverse transcriptase (RNA-dependent DNA polymerase)